MTAGRARLRLSWLAVLLACACAPTIAPPRGPQQPRARQQAGKLSQQIALARKGGTQPIFAAPTPDQMKAMERWTRGRLLGSTRPAPPGFLVHSLTRRPDLSIARESDAPTGSGVYVLRDNAPRLPVMIQVPHSWADMHTLPLGLTLFDTLRARALLVNTAHRNRACPPGQMDCVSDMAHTERSYFQAVHRGVLSAHPDAVTIALHGFAERKDDPLLILSSAGTPVQLEEIQQQLNEVLAELHETPVLRYPDEIDRLGGLTGSQAQHVRRNAGRMLHLEMSRKLRERLRDDPELRRRLGEALDRGLETLR